jgi:putative transposase
MAEKFEVRGMPRRAKLDVAGTLHHIMLRGIEKKEIFEDALDREGFVNRMGKLALETRTKIYAWSLITNHVLCCAQHK